MKGSRERGGGFPLRFGALEATRLRMLSFSTCFRLSIAMSESETLCLTKGQGTINGRVKKLELALAGGGLPVGELVGCSRGYQTLESR